MKKDGTVFLSSLALGILLALFYLYTDSEVVILAVTFIIGGVLERLDVLGDKGGNQVLFKHYKDLLIVYLYLSMIAILLLKYLVFPVLQIQRESKGFTFLFLLGLLVLTFLNVYLFKGVKKAIDDIVKRKTL